jgi:hypothetical protein
MPVKAAVMTTTGKERTPTSCICLNISLPSKGGRKIQLEVWAKRIMIFPASSKNRIV